MHHLIKLVAPCLTLSTAKSQLAKAHSAPAIQAGSSMISHLELQVPYLPSWPTFQCLHC